MNLKNMGFIILTLVCQVHPAKPPCPPADLKEYMEKSDNDSIYWTVPQSLEEARLFKEHLSKKIETTQGNLKNACRSQKRILKADLFYYHYAFAFFVGMEKKFQAKHTKESIKALKKRNASLKKSIELLTAASKQDFQTTL